MNLNVNDYRRRRLQRRIDRTQRDLNNLRTQLVGMDSTASDSSASSPRWNWGEICREAWNGLFSPMRSVEVPLTPPSVEPDTRFETAIEYAVPRALDADVERHDEAVSSGNEGRTYVCVFSFFLFQVRRFLEGTDYEYVEEDRLIRQVFEVLRNWSVRTIPNETHYRDLLRRERILMAFVHIWGNDLVEYSIDPTSVGEEETNRIVSRYEEAYKFTNRVHLNEMLLEERYAAMWEQALIDFPARRDRHFTLREQANDSFEASMNDRLYHLCQNVISEINSRRPQWGMPIQYDSEERELVVKVVQEIMDGRTDMPNMPDLWSWVTQRYRQWSQKEDPVRWMRASIEGLRRHIHSNTCHPVYDNFLRYLQDLKEKTGVHDEIVNRGPVERPPQNRYQILRGSQ